MNEAALAGQVERLARSVRRWRLATFVFAVLFVCALAVGGTSVTMLMLQLPGRRDVQMIILNEQEARRQAEVARDAAEAARRDAEEARRRLERELAAKKIGGDGP